MQKLHVDRRMNDPRQPWSVREGPLQILMATLGTPGLSESAFWEVDARRGLSSVSLGHRYLRRLCPDPMQQACFTEHNHVRRRCRGLTDQSDTVYRHRLPLSHRTSQMTDYMIDQSSWKKKCRGCEANCPPPSFRESREREGPSIKEPDCAAPSLERCEG